MKNRLLFFILLFANCQAFSSPLGPPNKIFHFGKLQFLETYGREHRIPPGDWRSYVMGGGGRFDLKPFRRGYYGSGSMAAAAPYGDDILASGDMPWVVAVRIKKECLEPEHVSHGVFSLPGDKAFSRWFDQVHPQNMNTWQELIYNCYPRLSHRTQWSTADGFHLILSFEAENQCEKTASQYFAENGIGLVRDENWNDSWYVRDLKCIESIDGTPEQVLDFLASEPTVWEQSMRSSPVKGDSEEAVAPGVSLYLIMLRALQKAPEDLIINHALYQSPAAPWIAVFDRCQKKGQRKTAETAVDDFIEQLLTAQMGRKNVELTTWLTTFEKDAQLWCL